MILTEGDKMVLTPTYHVFEMFNVHQGATAIPLDITTGDYVCGEKRIPAVSASASRRADGKLNVSLVNVDPNKPAEVEFKIQGFKAKFVAGRVLTAPKMDSENTYDKPDSVAPAKFSAVKISGGIAKLSLPAKSVVVLEIAGE
jgi:alpha-N-arabinofuranosidase